MYIDMSLRGIRWWRRRHSGTDTWRLYRMRSLYGRVWTERHLLWRL